MRREWIAVLATALAVLGALATAAPASATGELDPSFGDHGTIVTSVGTWSSAYDVAVQPDGSVVLAGSSYGPDRPGGFALQRLTPDGTLDPTFSGDGKVKTVIGRSSVIYGVALQPDGRIVAAGYATRTRGDVFAVARYDADGSLDDSFSGDGIWTGLSGGAEAVAIQPDGSIVVVGEGGHLRYQIAVVRLLPDGTLDPSFARDGHRLVRFDDHPTLGTSVALGPSGAIVVGGLVPEHRWRIALAELTPFGALDPSFGTQGRTIVGSTESITALDLALDVRGRIVIAGASGGSLDVVGSRFAVVRVLPDGRLDPRFSVDGIATTQIGRTAGAAALALPPGGAILVAGTAMTAGGTYDFAIARYGRHGRLDASFSSNGWRTTSIGRDALAHAMTLQSDGKAIVAGESPNRMAVARFIT